MRLFCFGDHSEVINIERNLDKELVRARARLARLQKLPLSSFPEETNQQMRFANGQIMFHTVDMRDDAIAKAEADIAELEILAGVDE